MATYLSKADHEIVREAVAAAELHTSGEIVTVLADRSDGYTDVALVWAIALAFTMMSLFAAFPEPFLNLWDGLMGGWTDHNWTTGQLASMTIGLGVLAFGFSLCIFLPDRIRFATIPGPVKTARVHSRAIKHFKVGAERRTHGHTGILLYLSMREHRAEIVADAPIATKVSADVWGEAMADMLGEIKQGHIAQGLALGIADVGKVLAEHFPIEEGDENELPDRLIEV